MNALTKILNHLSRRWFAGHPAATPADMRGKRVVVTGAARGSIGFITAKTLASWGADVVVSRRSDADALAADIGGELPLNCRGAVTGFSLDLAKADSVADFAEAVHQRFDGLDVLINNAGIHLDLLSEWKTPSLTQDGFEIHWRTNYLGGWQLTRELLPLLQKGAATTGDARVVNVVSHLHSKGLNEHFFNAPQTYNSWQAYGQSKLGLIHHAMEIERRYGAAGLHGYAVHPGSIYTNIAHQGLAGHGLLQRVRQSLGFIEKRILLTPEQGAQTQLHCATAAAAEPGKYYQRCAVAQPDQQAMDLVVAQKLWLQTEQWWQQVNTSRGAAGRLKETLDYA